ncbi:tubulin epsilon and delta complex protein 2 isoform X2 [Lepus europaeus]|uniref:tubulin epsilon and delta complex protein 2 isoform X2 n=1 Tax=Lepus europaeus TaxID=9983 RepID=UPI002B4A84F6|nr:tubulin epsilon and delta complex protein 2 isoform X2 [Lepus europaeus]
MLPAGCSRRLVAELQGALDACAERQKQLERSLGVCRRLLQAWEPARTWAPDPPPGPETTEEDPPPARTPSPQDLKELELLTQALEKAARVRRSVCRAGGRGEAGGLTPGPAAASAGTAVPGPGRGGPGPAKGIRQARTPATDHPELRPLPGRDRAGVGTRARAAEPGRSLRDQRVAPSTAPQAPGAFTLKEQGLWAQLESAQTRDPTDAAAAARARFLQKMQPAVSLLGSPGWGGGDAGRRGSSLTRVQSGWPSPRPSGAELEAEGQRLRRACVLMSLHMREALSAARSDWTQEYHCLLTLEGLQAMVGRCLQELQELQADRVTEDQRHVPFTGSLSKSPQHPRLGQAGAGSQELQPGLPLAEQPPGPCLAGWRPQPSSPCGGRAGPTWSPRLLCYSSTQELQTLAALRLRVAMLHQQIHLQKVLMAELLPVLSAQEARGPPCLALCRAVHSLLCEGGEHFFSILRDDLAD